MPCATAALESALGTIARELFGQRSRWGYLGTRTSVVKRTIRLVESHEAAREAQLCEWAAMTMEERLRVGKELHQFWRRNFFPDARRLDRTVQVVHRPRS